MLTARMQPGPGQALQRVRGRPQHGSMTYSIVTDGLVKRFGQTRALDGIGLAVRTGSVFGLLGPNGAGKTTAVRILATLVGGRRTGRDRTGMTAPWCSATLFHDLRDTL